MPRSDDLPYDYSEFNEPVEGSNEFAILSGLVDEQAGLEDEIEELEKQLKAKKDALRILSETRIPALMLELGQEIIKTPNGNRVDIVEKIRASIPKAREAEAIEWLDNNGHGGLAKRQFIIQFNREDKAWADKFQRDLAQRKKPVQCDRRVTVHGNTLSAFVKGALEDGEDIPLDLLGVFRQRVAKIKR